MTRKGNLRQLVELRAMRMRRADEKAQRQHNRHVQTVRALEDAKAESVVHEMQRRQEEEALYTNLAQGPVGQRDLERFRDVLLGLDHRARVLEEQIHQAKRRESQEAEKRAELAAEYRLKHRHYERIRSLAAEKQQKDEQRAGLLDEIEDEEAIRPGSRKR
ncbi:MAG TPA: YscO family type III secretion system apparatus protein [Rhizobium sp.]|nr:YscO family type III secretion system apparatus protein [Rhizobium sp.]